ncbi:MAG: ATP-binding protein, partial [Pseudomonadota bacterium]
MASIQSLPLLLKELRLTAIGKAWQSLSEKAIKEAWEPAQFLVELCEIENNQRYENKLKRLLKESQLPMHILAQREHRFWTNVNTHS